MLIIMKDFFESYSTPHWIRLASSISNRESILVLGGVDSGKSTLVRWLAKYFVKQGKITAVVDCDMGQSDIGPPAAVSFAMIHECFNGYDYPPPCELHYTGNVSPSGSPLQSLTGAVRMREAARRAGAAHTIINTTGWIDRSAISFKHCKIDALNPSAIIALEKERELSAIVSPFKKISSIKLYRIGVSPQVQIKSQEYRRQMRKENFDGYFVNAGITILNAGRIGCSGVVFPLKKELIVNQLTALIDHQGRHLALGIITQYDEKNRLLEILTPYRDKPSLIGRLHFENFYPDYIAAKRENSDNN